MRKERTIKCIRRMQAYCQSYRSCYKSCPYWRFCDIYLKATDMLPDIPLSPVYTYMTEDKVIDKLRKVM